LSNYFATARSGRCTRHRRISVELLPPMKPEQTPTADRERGSKGPMSEKPQQNGTRDDFARLGRSLSPASSTTQSGSSATRFVLSRRRLKLKM
jgi:hypothetical protein